MAGFMPKQVTQYEASHLVELQGECSEIVVDSVLQAITSIPSGSVVHDNACGTGVVFQRIFEKDSNAKDNVVVEATDVNEFFVAGAEHVAKEHGWPVSTASGATAAATIWIDMPFANALLKTHHTLRGQNAPAPVHLAQLWYGELHLRKNLENGGFESDKLKCYEKAAYLTHPNLERWVQLAWSYLGAPPAGWTQNDEEIWDKALQTTIDYLKKEPGYSVNEKGENVMKMKAVVAIATK